MELSNFFILLTSILCNPRFLIIYVRGKNYKWYDEEIKVKSPITSWEH